MQRGIINLALVLSLLPTSFFTIAACAGSSMEDGITAYKSARYGEALAKFAQASNAAPTSAAIHYYLGLCYQRLNRLPEATEQYKWVANNSHDAEVRKLANTALLQLTEYQARSLQISVASAPTQQNDFIATRQDDIKKVHLGCIIDCYTDWCVPCKKFLPVWDAVAAKMGDRIKFKRMNIERDADFAKYKDAVREVPTILFVATDGQLVNQSGAFASEKQFIDAINEICK